ncbi:OmpA family protein [Photobacterium damselae]
MIRLTLKNPEELDKLYNKITDKSTLISINGYTDNTGSDRYNYMLSEKKS